MKDEKKYYVTTWRNKGITSEAESINDFIKVFEDLAKMFSEWKDKGIKLCDNGGISDDYAHFYTDDKDVAIEAGFTYTNLNDENTKYLRTYSGEEVKIN